MYLVEGNIGAGKSTFLRLIDQHMPEVTVLFEPLARWDKQESGQSLLKEFYHDQQRWSFTIEMFAMACRVREHLNEQQNSNSRRILERSIYSGHYCFAKNGYLNGKMSLVEWDIYNKWFDLLIPGKCTPPHGFIYLKCSSQTAYGRVKKRARSSECDISLAYIQQIDQRHDELLLDRVGVTPELLDVPVLVLDVNEEFETNPERIAQMCDQLRTFMTQSTLNALLSNSALASL